VLTKKPNLTKLTRIKTYLRTKTKLWLIWQNLRKFGTKKVF